MRGSWSRRRCVHLLYVAHASVWALAVVQNAAGAAADARWRCTALMFYMQAAGSKGSADATSTLQAPAGGCFVIVSHSSCVTNGSAAARTALALVDVLAGDAVDEQRAGVLLADDHQPHAVRLLQEAGAARASRCAGE